MTEATQTAIPGTERRKRKAPRTKIDILVAALEAAPQDMKVSELVKSLKTAVPEVIRFKVTPVLEDDIGHLAESVAVYLPAESMEAYFDQVLRHGFGTYKVETLEVIEKPDDIHSGGWIATIPKT